MSELVEGTFDSQAVGAPVAFRVLLPAGDHDRSTLPFALHLHGARSSSLSLARRVPMYEQLWASGELPPMVVACADVATEGGFYTDQPGGAQWETLLAEEFPATIAARFGTRPVADVLYGVSMGGYGVLKLAFAAPEHLRAVAAISPVVFPAEDREAVPTDTAPSILGDLHANMAGDRGDDALYAHNSVYARARRNRDRIRAAAPSLLVDCGLRDEFRLYEGAEFLHRMLWDLGVVHDFRLVADSAHMGPEADRRELDALRFIGRALTTPRAAATPAPGDRTATPPV